MNDQIKKLVMESLIQVKEENELDFEPAGEITLLGKGGVMDSMDFVNFVVCLEENLLEELDISASILSDKAFSRKKSPFENIDSLTDYIVEMVQ